MDNKPSTDDRDSQVNHQSISLAIKTLCDTHEDIQNLLCLSLSKTRLGDIQLNDLLTTGKNNVKKQFLAEKMLNLLNAVDPVVNFLNSEQSCNIIQSKNPVSDGLAHLSDKLDKHLEQFSVNVHNSRTELNNITQKIENLQLSVNYFIFIGNFTNI